MQLTSTERNTRLTTIKTLLDAGGAGTGKLKVYTGTAPGVGNAATGTLLVTFTSVAMSAPSGGASTITGSGATAVAGSSATPGYARLTDSSDNVVAELTAGVSSGEVSFPSTINSGTAYNFGTCTLTEGNA